jgi:hypothetical protein
MIRPASHLVRAGALLFLLCGGGIPAAADETGQAAEPQKIEVRVSDVSARVSPSFEFVLPTGNIYEKLMESFNHLEMSFGLNYNFLQNSIAADVDFAYPYRRITPEIRFFIDLDFENTIYPVIEGGRLVLSPTEKYISRDRGLQAGIGYTLFDGFQLVPSFIVTDVFNGNLTEERVLDEGTDLTLRVGAVYHAMEAQKPEQQLLYSGLYFNSFFDLVFRNSFGNPTSFSNTNSLIFRYSPHRNWQLEENVSLNYPIKTFHGETSSYYTLGGFDTIRGFPHESINVFRFLLVATSLEREILKSKEAKLKVWRLQTRVHQFHVLFFLDQLFAQDVLDISSRVDSYTSVGTGLSFVLSGESSNHLKTELFVAQALARGISPILYFKTSFYRF